ncbi:hypothetical protein GE061_003382 [Apolygus lucorum]|uniref:C2H2-type domain-containing protein n=1 Tax=Apolygus lucorum TaxID=248454 RepID=A0A8S9X1X1_APOLU|nr:hypothetical protein GE061_003382 [Apolygus lucorum]
MMSKLETDLPESMEQSTCDPVHHFNSLLQLRKLNYWFSMVKETTTRLDYYWSTLQFVANKRGLKFLCGKCLKSFNSRDLLTRHQKTECGKKGLHGLKCPHCTIRMNNMKAINIHMAREHMDKL